MAITISSTGGGSSGDASSGNISIPAVSAGDLLVIVVSFENNPSMSASFPGDWTQVGVPSGYDGWTRNYIMKKLFVAGQGATTIPITVSPPTSWTSHVFKCSGASGNVEFAAVQSNGPAQANPPALTPTWGAKESGWIAMETGNGWIGFSGTPSGYGGHLYTRQPAGDGASMDSFYRVATTATEDPGAWTVVDTTNAAAITIGIEPASAITPPPVVVMI